MPNLGIFCLKFLKKYHQKNAFSGKKPSKKVNIRRRRRWLLFVYDTMLLVMIEVLLPGIYRSGTTVFHVSAIAAHTLLAAVCIQGCRSLAGVYRLIWRYGGASAYIRLILSDLAAGILYALLPIVLPVERIAFVHAFSIAAFNLLSALSIRLLNQYLYERAGRKAGTSVFSRKAVEFVTGLAFDVPKRYVREFEIENLLFRQPIEFNDEKTNAYYKDKIVLITGGGGSIGSELCRQIAKMQPKSLILLDIYENGAYDIQQELRIVYGSALDLHVEIVSICDRAGLENVFDAYHPDIVIHAAAHKHVPLMEHNCCEAVKNNVFGTLNAVELSEKYHVGRFIMVSTDKAVNPTNVMGATKRMCEMIVQSHSRSGSGTVYSATRFGNVLGSAGSVVPLFRKQIMNGGPVTVTDRRIIRYFMTIPEASQLVLQSGAMAKNGELFVLDMGKPVRILELAENMIRLSGYEPYRDIEIIETGIRPGEKLYEELLIRTEELDKTENSMIFIERDTPLPLEEIHEKLAVLRDAVTTEEDDMVKEALRAVVPTFYNPEDINDSADHAREMRRVEKS